MNMEYKVIRDMWQNCLGLFLKFHAGDMDISSKPVDRRPVMYDTENLRQNFEQKPMSTVR